MSAHTTTKQEKTQAGKAPSLKEAAERVVVMLRAPSGGFSTQAAEDALDDLERALGRDPSVAGREFPDLTVAVDQGGGEPARMESSLV